MWARHRVGRSCPPGGIDSWPPSNFENTVSVLLNILWTGPASGRARGFISPPTPAGSPPGNSWRTWPRATKRVNRRPREPDWSQSYCSLRLPKKRWQQRDSHRRRRPDPARRRPLWLSGQLPPSHHGPGAGHQNPSHRGGGPERGSPRGGYRGADLGHRGPLKGGQRGRWGRW
jgi:hypothetical protein